VEDDLEDDFADLEGFGLLVALDPLGCGPRVQEHFGARSLQRGVVAASTVPKD